MSAAGAPLGPRLVAEALGTFFLVLIGPGAAAVNAFTHGAIGPVGVGLAFAFVLIATIHTLGHISGAHFNPAVTIAFAMNHRITARDAAGYIAAQLSAAVFAATGLSLLLGDAARASATVPTVPVIPGLWLEVALTFLLMLVIMAVATDARVSSSLGAVAIGVAVGADAIMGGPLTGASMNPARSFGPAVATGQWTAHWIYWVGPMVGATVAVLLYEFMRRGAGDR